jgi:hypothetical protein
MLKTPTRPTTRDALLAGLERLNIAQDKSSQMLYQLEQIGSKA